MESERQLADIISRFESAYGRHPDAAGVAPGRIEVLGNHTDYNQGFVLSAATEQCTYVAISRGLPGSTTTRCASSCKEGMKSFEVCGDKVPNWAVYVQGVLQLWCSEAKDKAIFDIYICTELPLGSGLSSSAALEMAVINAVGKIFPRPELSALDTVKMGMKAENEHVGVGCGMLDQYTSTFGRKNQLTFLDCRSSSSDTAVWKEDDAVFVVLNTKAPHRLVDGEYMERRQCCEAAASKCGVPFLRDISMEALDEANAQGKLSDKEYRRAKHVVGENERVQKAIKSLENWDVKEFGHLLSQSHESSCSNFENSWEQANMAIECATRCSGFLGGRMMGGGFGGCTLNLVERKTVEQFSTELREEYSKVSGLEGITFIVSPSNGARGYILQKPE